MGPDGKLISLIFGHLPTSITSIVNEQEAVYCRCNVHVLFSELALYALDVYYMQTYSGMYTYTNNYNYMFIYNYKNI